MVYEFAAKIKEIQNINVLNKEALACIVAEADKKFEKPMVIKTMLSDKEPPKDILVKSETSVSSLPRFHDDELNTAIDMFKAYLDALEKATNGAISKNDAFYNNTKMFSRLYI